MSDPFEHGFIDIDACGLTELQKQRAVDAFRDILTVVSRYGGPDDGMGILFALTDCLCIAVDIGRRRRYVTPEQAQLIVRALTRAAGARPR